MKSAKAGLKSSAVFVSLDRTAVLTGALESFPLLSPITTNLNAAVEAEVEAVVVVVVVAVVVVMEVIVVVVGEI